MYCCHSLAKAAKARTKVRTKAKTVKSCAQISCNRARVSCIATTCVTVLRTIRPLRSCRFGGYFETFAAVLVSSRHFATHSPPVNITASAGSYPSNQTDLSSPKCNHCRPRLGSTNLATMLTTLAPAKVRGGRCKRLPMFLPFRQGQPEPYNGHFTA